MTRFLESLTVFYGELTPNRAVVHAHLAGGEDLAELTLAGIVRGPSCSRGSTLPATYRLAGQVSDLSRPNSGQVGNLSYVSAQALITEPVFWTPDWPAVYEVTAELKRGSETIEQTTRTIGLRPLAVLEKGFDFGGRFWILRGVHRDQNIDPAIIDECREHAAALMAPAELLSEPLLTKASQEGVLLVAELQKKTTTESELSRLARFAAVAIVVLPPGDLHLPTVPRHNFVLAQRAAHDGRPLLNDVRVVLADVVNDWDFADWAKTVPRPVIAYRRLDRQVDIATARAECDRLQRDLAPYGQFAGYIV